MRQYSRDVDHLGLAAAGFDIVQPFARGLLVGNTRALWEPFVANRRDEPDPLDRYTERCMTAAFPGQVIAYAHAKPYLPFQQYAVEAGLAALSATHLAIHPVYGPWFALRALIMGPGTPQRPIAAPCTCTEECDRAFARALAATGWEAWLAVRDACSIGTTWRYSDEQLRYHYTRSLLVR